MLSLAAALPVIALDGDTAGTEGTDRWVHQLCVESRRPVLVIRLAVGVDPADWLAEHGTAGLSAFDPAAPNGSALLGVRPEPPAVELTRLALSRGPDASRELARVVVPLLAELPRTEANRLAAGIERAVADTTGGVAEGDRVRLHAALAHATQQPRVRAFAASAGEAAEASWEPPSYAPSLN